MTDIQIEIDSLKKEAEAENPKVTAYLVRVAQYNRDAIKSFSNKTLIILSILVLGLFGLGIVTISTQSDLSETTRESAKTRVKTVEQRCQLTNLITEVLSRDDPKRVGAFEKSYNKCESQLKEVKHIAAKAP